VKIALDYDRTYQHEKDFWDAFLLLSKAAGHQVWIVTARSPVKDRLTTGQVSSATRELLQDIIYCDGIAKRWALHHFHDLDIDVWIDDKPDNILENSSATKEVLKGWRESEEYRK
jgi:hypothetical protein